jgi:hypothetical protein
MASKLPLGVEAALDRLSRLLAETQSRQIELQLSAARSLDRLAKRTGRQAMVNASLSLGSRVRVTTIENPSGCRRS